MTTANTGTYTWAGETWNMPADSGISKNVCPTFYEQRVVSSYPKVFRLSWAGDGIDLYNQEVWATLYGSYGGISPASTYNYPDIAYSDISIYNAHIGAQASHQVVVGNRDNPTPWTNTNWQSYGGAGGPFGIFPQPPPGKTITDRAKNLFGSYTTGGVTYAWDKGAGW
jgi:hypothetical protein